MTSNSLITKGNELISASYALSLSETRVILLCLAKIDPRKPLPLNLEFTITAKDFYTELGLDQANAYRDLQVAVDKLYERSILIDHSDPGSRMRWIYKKAYSKAKGEVTLKFPTELAPFISELSSRFTTYKLKDVAKFKSSYGIRIYELLVQFKDRHERKISVDELRVILALGSKYPKIEDLKKYVVLPSLQDINDHSNVTVDLGQEKHGKQITHLIFKYSIIGVIDKKPIITKAYIEKHARVGESWEDARQRLNGRTAPVA